MTDGGRQVIVDTDTGSDDALALLMAGLSERLAIEAVTIVEGNVAFDRQVENAKYALSLAGLADAVPVHEGARSPLCKDWDHAHEVHGEGGLGDLRPTTGGPSADAHAVDAIVEALSESPGEVSLLCLGPLTNVALALSKAPSLGEWVDEVWVMGGAVGARGNVTPAAEFNFWVDPDAAKCVAGSLDLTLVDWGVSEREGRLDVDHLAPLDAIETRYGEFFRGATATAREAGDGLTLADPLLTAIAIEPTVATEVGSYELDVDEREGSTRGYSWAREAAAVDGRARARVVEAADGEAFRAMLASTLRGAAPEAGLDR